MIAVIQRVKEARVEVDSKVVGKIGQGLLVFLGVSGDDKTVDADYLATKIAQLRIFEDEAGKMNLSAVDIKAKVLVVSQFTLLGNCEKGRRPSFEKAADPKKAQELYEYFIEELKGENLAVESGIFRAMMDVHLINDGPVTFVLESKNN